MIPIKSFKVVECSNLTSNHIAFFEDGSTFLQDFRVNQKMIFSPNVILVIWVSSTRIFSQLQFNSKKRETLFENIFFSLSSFDFGHKSGIYTYRFKNNFERFKNFRHKGSLKAKNDLFIDNSDEILDIDSIFVFDICENLDDFSNEEFFSKYKDKYKNFDCQKFIQEILRKSDFKFID